MSEIEATPGEGGLSLGSGHPPFPFVARVVATRDAAGIRGDPSVICPERPRRGI